MLKKMAAVALIPFLVLGAVGYLTSLVVHIIAFAALVPVHPGLLIGLIVGVFAASIPAVIVVNVMVITRGLIGFSRKMYRQQQEVIHKYSPTWMRWLVGLSGVYAVINFVLSIVLIETSSNPDNYLHSENFLGIRMMTGHFMAFYSFSFSALYSRVVEALLDKQNTWEPGRNQN